MDDGMLAPTLRAGIVLRNFDEAVVLRRRGTAIDLRVQLTLISMRIVSVNKDHCN